MIPALANAEFVRYGVMHRNTYLNSPGLLDRYYRLIADDRISFAGQMTGVEGYVESAGPASSRAWRPARRLLGQAPSISRARPPSAPGAVCERHDGRQFPADERQLRHHAAPASAAASRGKRNKNAELSRRSLEIIDSLRETSSRQ